MVTSGLFFFPPPFLSDLFCICQAFVFEYILFPMTPYLLLFDIDGTLLSAGGCGKIAIDRTFKEIFSVSGAWANTFPDGKTDLLIFNEIAERCIGRKLKNDEWETLSNLYAQYFEEESEKPGYFKTTPGARNLLEKLADLPQIHLSVATGNIEKVSWIKLHKANLHSFFKCGGFGSNHINRTGILNDAIASSESHFGHQYSKKNVFVIGDTRHDVIAAHALELRSIGVDTGSTGGRDFEEAQPHHRFSDFCDAGSFIQLFND